MTPYHFKAKSKERRAKSQCVRAKTKQSRFGFTSASEERRENGSFHGVRAKTKQSRFGFTLIEVLLYLALFGILMGGAIVAAYGLFESGSRNQTQSMVQEEGNFLLAKVEWAFMSGVTDVSINSSGSELTIDRFSASDVVLEVVAGTLQINTGSGFLPLNNDNVIVINSRDALGNPLPYFVEIPASAGVSGHVRATFTLAARTPTGLLISQDFGITGYTH